MLALGFIFRYQKSTLQCPRKSVSPRVWTLLVSTLPSETAVRHYLARGSLRLYGPLHRPALGHTTSSSSLPSFPLLMRFSLSTTPVTRPITASHPLCEESKHLPMPSEDKGPPHKALKRSLSYRNLGHSNFRTILTKIN